jgi:hypothetical protein
VEEQARAADIEVGDIVLFRTAEERLRPALVIQLKPSGTVGGEWDHFDLFVFEPTANAISTKHGIGPAGYHRFNVTRGDGVGEFRPKPMKVNPWR